MLKKRVRRWMLKWEGTNIWRHIVPTAKFSTTSLDHKMNDKKTDDLVESLQNMFHYQPAHVCRFQVYMSNRFKQQN